VAGISTATGSEVVMNDVFFSNNKAEGECGAISNYGALSLRNIRIYGNTADNISAICNSRNGKVILGKDVQISNNNAPQDVHSEGTIDWDFS
jgi:hypothetical protein